jgi:hypothetical protein
VKARPELGKGVDLKSITELIRARLWPPDPATMRDLERTIAGARASLEHDAGRRRVLAYYEAIQARIDRPAPDPELSSGLARVIREARRTLARTAPPIAVPEG